jgi:hypothetical protein
VYLRHHLSKDELDRAKQNIIFYTVCVLYVLSVVVVALDIAILAVDVFVCDNELFF